MAEPTIPMSTTQVLDAYFLENRARILEVASFLDRVDRTRDSGAGRKDFRYRAFMKALKILAEGVGNRAEAVHMIFSDLSSEPRQSAAGMKGASGAWKEASLEDH